LTGYPNVKYVKISDGTGYLTFTQIKIYDTSDTNVALNTSPTSSGIYSTGYEAANVVSGRSTPGPTVDASYGYGIIYNSSSQTNAWLQVPLASAKTINRVYIINRADHDLSFLLARGYRVYLLDENQIPIYVSHPLTADMTQTIRKFYPYSAPLPPLPPMPPLLPPPPPPATTNPICNAKPDCKEACKQADIAEEKQRLAKTKEDINKYYAENYNGSNAEGFSTYTDAKNASDAAAAAAHAAEVASAMANGASATAVAYNWSAAVQAAFQAAKDAALVCYHRANTAKTEAETSKLNAYAYYQRIITNNAENTDSGSSFQDYNPKPSIGSVIINTFMEDINTIRGLIFG